MAKLSSALFKVFLVSGVSLLGVKPKAITDKTTNVLHNNTHGLGDDWAEHSAAGMMSGELAQSGAFFDTVVGGVHAAFKDVSNVVRVVVYAAYGNLIGRPFVGWEGAYQGSYDVISQGLLVEANATYAATGRVDRGQILQHWKAHTADWNTGTEFSLSITRSGSTATATTSVSHGYAVGSQVIVTIAGAVEPEYNGRVTATMTGASTFTYDVSGTPDTPATGTITGGVTVDYTLDPLNLSVPITSNSIADPTVVTTPVPHKLQTDDVILISDVATSEPTINGERVVTVLSPTSFSVPVAVTTGGTGGSFKRSSANNGGVGYQAVSDQDAGVTGFVGKLQHSADGLTSWSDLVTFSDSPESPSTDRKSVTGTVHRFRRYNGDMTGTGSIKPFAGFATNAPQ